LIHLNRETPTGIPANLLPPPPFATLRQSPAVKPGEQVIAYGFPLRGALADEGNLTIGNVSAMRGLNNDPNEIQISAPVQPGNSGGPLLDSSGNVIGVVASKLDALNALVRSGDLPQNVNFAISLPVLKAFLARSGARATESASRLELRPDEVGDRAKSFTYAIECNPQPSTQSQSTGGWEVISRRPAAPDPQLTPRTADPPRTVKTVEIKSDRLLPSGIGTNERLIVVSKGQTLSTILGGIGATGADIAVIAAVLGSYGSALRQGDKLRILLPEGERARPARVVVLGANGKVKAAAALSDSGKYFSVDLSTAGALE
jgi:hypothetical protein